jgi:small membrane protein
LAISSWGSWPVGIKILLTFGLVVFLVYGITQRGKSRFVFQATLAIGAAGLFFVWMPEQANDLAYLLGVGRGADLIFYCWILTSLLMALNLHVLIRENQQMTTELARQLALAHPLKPLDRINDGVIPGTAIECKAEDSGRVSGSGAEAWAPAEFRGASHPCCCSCSC